MNMFKVLTTGVFDLLHPNHISLFRRIRERYPKCKLIVGVNGNRRVSEIKQFVLFNARERKSMLEALVDVDRVVIFEEDTPTELVGRIKPNVFVKGVDWIGKKLPEQPICDELGVEIEFISSGGSFSSSELKRRLAAWVSQHETTN